MVPDKAITIWWHIHASKRKKCIYNTYSCAIFFFFYLPSFIHSFYWVNGVRWHQIATGHFFLLLKILFLVLFMLLGPNDVDMVKTHKSSNYVICQRVYSKGMVYNAMVPGPTGILCVNRLLTLFGYYPTVLWTQDLLLPRDCRCAQLCQPKKKKINK